MKRFGKVLAAAFVASMISGCENGIPEGPPKDGPTDPQPADFKNYMKQNAGNMTNKKPAKTKTAPASTSAPEAKETP